MDIAALTDLPVWAQRLLAERLPVEATAACRLASTALSSLRATPTGTHVWVVSSTFQQQVGEELRHSTVHAAGSSDRGAAAQAGGGAGDDGGSSWRSLLPARSLAAAAQGARTALLVVDDAMDDPCPPRIWRLLFGALLSSPTLEHLVVAECVDARFDADSQPREPGEDCSGRRPQARPRDGWLAALLRILHAEQERERAQQQDPQAERQRQQEQRSWQQWQDHLRLHGRLDEALYQQELQGRQQMQEQLQQWRQQDQQKRPDPAAASLRALTLQLLTPVPIEQQCLLMQLTRLERLALVPTAECLELLGSGPARQPHGDPLHGPSVSPWVWCDLSGDYRTLPCRFSSLTMCVGEEGRPLPEGGAALHKALLQLGRHLTHLSIDAKHGPWSTHYSLAAPWHMPALRSLTCGLGCSLELPVLREGDDDDSQDDDDDDEQQQHELGGGGSGSGGGAAPQHAGGVQLFPALTELRLLSGVNVAATLRALCAAAAPCRQLQRLQLPLARGDGGGLWQVEGNAAAPGLMANGPPDDDLRRLGRLKGLRHLRAVMGSRQQVEAMLAAVGPQLLGLTLTVSARQAAVFHEDFGPAPEAQRVPLALLLSGVPRLTDLKLVSDDALCVLDPAQDFAVARDLTPELQQLAFIGGMRAAPTAGVQLTPGLLPPRLQGLTLVARQGCQDEELDGQGSYVMHPGGLPDSLTSLKLQGFGVVWQPPVVLGGPQQQPELVAGLLAEGRWLELLPTQLEKLELELPPLYAWHLPTGRPASSSQAVLPRLRQLTLHLPEEIAEEKGATLRPLLSCLSQLISLSALHLDRRYRDHLYSGIGLSSLSSLVGLQVLTLKVAPPTEALTKELCASLAGRLTSLRMLRLPHTSRIMYNMHQHITRSFPNCLICNGDDTLPPVPSAVV